MMDKDPLHKHDPGPFRSRTKSFEFAFSGFAVMVRTQPNFRFHLFAGTAAILLSWWLGIDRIQFAIIIIVIAMVLATEALNTSIEMVVNMFSTQRSWPAKWAKDISACAVLVASAGALVTGFLILGPPLYDRLLHML